MSNSLEQCRSSIAGNKVNPEPRNQSGEEVEMDIDEYYCEVVEDYIEPTIAAEGSDTEKIKKTSYIKRGPSLVYYKIHEFHNERKRIEWWNKEGLNTTHRKKARRTTKKMEYLKYECVF
jgi:hypothetical protein